MRAFLSTLTANFFRTAVTTVVVIVVVATGAALAADSTGLLNITLFPTSGESTESSYHLSILARIGQAEDSQGKATLFGRLAEVLLKLTGPTSETTPATSTTTTPTTSTTNTTSTSSTGGSTTDLSSIATLTNQTTILNRLGTSSDLSTGSTIFANLLALKGNLDVSVSSRLAASSYIAPDNTTIGLISSRLGTNADPSGTLSIFARLASIDSDVDAAISTRAASSTALSNLIWTDTKASYIDVVLSSRAPSSTALSNIDWTVARAAKMDNLDALISSRAASSTALSNLTWTDAKAALLDAAISSLAPASTALSTATWTNTLATNLATTNSRVDTTVSSRAPASTALSNSTWTDTKAGYLDAAITSRAGRPAAPTYFQRMNDASQPDTGPLAAGEYEVVAYWGGGSSGNCSIGTARLAHRNAADSGEILSVRLNSDAVPTTANTVWWPRITVAANERFRIERSGYCWSGYSEQSLYVRLIP